MFFEANLRVSLAVSSSGGGPPVVGDCEGDYLYEPRRNTLLWQLAVVDSSNKTGAMEFSVPSGSPGQLFPVQVTFTSLQSFARLSVLFSFPLYQAFLISMPKIKIYFIAGDRRQVDRKWPIR